MAPETCDFAQQPGIAKEEALKKGMEEKSRQFVEKGAGIYAKRNEASQHSTNDNQPARSASMTLRFTQRRNFRSASQRPAADCQRKAMNDDAGFPKLSSAQRTGTAGVTIVTGLVENEFKWRFRLNHQEDDFGIDGYVDIVRKDGAVLGKSFAVQIKTGPSHVAKTMEQGFLLYGELKHLNYPKTRRRALL